MIVLYDDEIWPTEHPKFEVDDVHFVQPVGFVWFSKPRYRIKAGSRPHKK